MLRQLWLGASLESGLTRTGAELGQVLTMALGICSSGNWAGLSWLELAQSQLKWCQLKFLYKTVIFNILLRAKQSLDRVGTGGPGADKAITWLSAGAFWTATTTHTGSSVLRSACKNVGSLEIRYTEPSPAEIGFFACGWKFGTAKRGQKSPKWADFKLFCSSFTRNKIGRAEKLQHELLESCCR